MRYLALLALLLPGAALAQPAGSYGPGPCPMGASSCVVTATGGTAARSLANQAGDFTNIKNFGATGNGIANDTAAIQSSGAVGPVYVPTGTYLSTLAQNAIVGAFRGPGQLETSDNNKRGPIVDQIGQAPSTVGGFGNVVSGFNSDLSHVPFAVEHRVTGVATLGQPTSGYVITPETAAYAGVFYNSSGWDNDPTGVGTGRTGVPWEYVNANQAGQGDLFVHYCAATVTSQLPGATTFLTEPAADCFAGQLASTVAGAFLQPIGDLNSSDGGNDIAVIGMTQNYNRTVATGDLNATWMGEYHHATGTRPLDAFFNGSGPGIFGIDLAPSSYPDVTIATVALSTGGSGCTVGDILTVPGGTAVDSSTTQFKVATVDGSGVVLTWTVTRNGKYTAAPAATVTMTGGTCSVAPAFNVTYGGNAAFAMRLGSKIYGNALNNSSTGFSNATAVGGDYIVDDSSNGWSVVSPSGKFTSGPSNTNLGSFSTAMGELNTVSSTFGGAFGAANSVTGQGSFAFGLNGKDFGVLYKTVQSGTGFSNVLGTNQATRILLSQTITGGSGGRLTADRAVQTTFNSANIQSGQDFAMDTRIACHNVTTAGHHYAYFAKLHVMRDVAVGTTVVNVISGTTFADAVGGDTWSTPPSFTADTTQGGVNVTVTPPGSDTWHCVFAGDSAEAQ